MLRKAERAPITFPRSSRTSRRSKREKLRREKKKEALQPLARPVKRKAGSLAALQENGRMKKVQGFTTGQKAYPQASHLLQTKKGQGRTVTKEKKEKGGSLSCCAVHKTGPVSLSGR